MVAVGLGCVFYLSELHLGQLHHLAVGRRNLGRTIHHRGAYLGYAGILEGLEDYFIADAVDVSVGDAHFYLVFHKIVCWA